MTVRMFRWSDIPKLPPVEFTYENSLCNAGIAMVAWLDTASGHISIEKGWSVVGCVDEVPKPNSAKDCVGLMVFHPRYGEIWQHYPEGGTKNLKFCGQLLADS